MLGQRIRGCWILRHSQHAGENVVAIDNGMFDYTGKVERNQGADREAHIAMKIANRIVLASECRPCQRGHREPVEDPQLETARPDIDWTGHEL